MFKKFSPSEIDIFKAVLTMDEDFGQKLYNLILNYDPYNYENKEISDKMFMYDFYKVCRSWDIGTPEFKKLFKQYDKFHGINTPDWEKDYSMYVDIIVQVGKKWVQINLPDEIDLCYDEIDICESSDEEIMI